MTQFNPTKIVQAAIDKLQTAIDALGKLKGDENADIPNIDRQITALQCKQADLQNQQLRTIEDSPENQDAINKMSAAAETLNGEAEQIQDATTAVKDAAAVVSAAASLITTLAPFF